VVGVWFGGLGVYLVRVVCEYLGIGIRVVVDDYC